MPEIAIRLTSQQFPGSSQEPLKTGVAWVTYSIPLQRLVFAIGYILKSVDLPFLIGIPSGLLFEYHAVGNHFKI